jgi:hypothetical protein
MTADKYKAFCEPYAWDQFRDELKNDPSPNWEAVLNAVQEARVELGKLHVSEAQFLSVDRILWRIKMHLSGLSWKEAGEKIRY